MTPKEPSPNAPRPSSEDADLAQDVGSEYEPVGIPWSWGGLAFIFLAALVILHLFDFGGLFQRARLTALGLVAGLVAGAIGLRFDAPPRAMARYALAIHGALLALIVLPLVGVAVWRLVLR